jgi:LAO/AO transport system kinase
MWERELQEIQNGNIKTIARCISVAENEGAGYETLLENLPLSNTPVIGITGPPGAGKSSIVNGFIRLLTGKGKKVGVICVDPSSIFSSGAILGDRIRMTESYNNPSVYIRSLATRGSLGGLHPKIIEISDILKASVFDYIIIETVGVGQTEIEIAGLADLTLVVLVPGTGDDIQTMKSGIMEIADLFVINKADLPGAATLEKDIREMMSVKESEDSADIPVLKTIATSHEGIDEAMKTIDQLLQKNNTNPKRFALMAKKAFYLIAEKKMKNIDPGELEARIRENEGKINLYRFIRNYV